EVLHVRRAEGVARLHRERQAAVPVLQPGDRLERERSAGVGTRLRNDVNARVLELARRSALEDVDGDVERLAVHADTRIVGPGLRLLRPALRRVDLEVPPARRRVRGLRDRDEDERIVGTGTIGERDETEACRELVVEELR